METVVSQLKNDPDLYQGWQANIAMAFVDEFHRSNEIASIEVIANTAAKNFLNLLIKPTEDETTK